jgi:hypothetical protein
VNSNSGGSSRGRQCRQLLLGARRETLLKLLPKYSGNRRENPIVVKL